MRQTFAAFVFVSLILFGTLVFIDGNNKKNIPAVSSERKKEADIVFAHTVVRAEVADTESSRIRGLSGRAPLPDGAGMWFNFGASELPGIWMKEMNFPIDILWFDEGLHVVFVKENASPSSYPEIFMPASPAQYVLEVPAGFVKKYGISLMESISLQSPKFPLQGLPL